MTAKLRSIYKHLLSPHHGWPTPYRKAFIRTTSTRNRTSYIDIALF